MMGSTMPSVGRPAPTWIGATTAIFTLLALSAVTALALNYLAAQTARGVTQAGELQTAITRSLVSLTDAETGQRGFLLTGQDEFLAPYAKSRDDLPEDKAIMRRLSVDIAGNDAWVDRYGELVQKKLDELATTIAAFQRGDRETALALVRSGEGKAVMDEIRKILNDAAEQARNLVVARRETVAERRAMATYAMALSLALLGPLGWFEFRRRRLVSEALAVSNASLEATVAARTAALERQKLRIEALLQDVTHRVGNNLAMVSGILSIQGRQAANPEVRTALLDAQARISAIAASQRRMKFNSDTDAASASEHLDNLLDDLKVVAAEKGVSIVRAIEDVTVPGGDVVPYVVLVNELVTNAVKHAFGSNGGTVSVSLSRIEIGGAPHNRIVVTDDGKGMADTPGSGLGQKVMKALLNSLSASMTVETARADDQQPGTSVTIDVPVSLTPQQRPT
jgi:two-component sensor histidine kinase